MLRKTRGFTLIEILLVVLLTSILAALVAPLGVEQVEKARAQSEWLTLDREAPPGLRVSRSRARRSDVSWSSH